MQKYELMVIIKNSLDAKAAEQHAKDLDGRIVKEFNGKITFSDFWGERGFAYKINKQKWGYYQVSQFNMEADQAQSLRHELNLDNALVRFMITKVDPKAPVPRKYADMKKEYEAQEKAKQAEKALVETTPVPVKKEKLTTITEETPKATENPKDELDKKLDAIIDEASDI